MATSCYDMLMFSLSLIFHECLTDFPCASLSTASGTGLTLATAGETQKFIITARTDLDFMEGDTAVMIDPFIPYSFAVHLGSSLQQSIIMQTVIWDQNRDTRHFVAAYLPNTAGTESLSVKLVKCEDIPAKSNSLFSIA